MLTKNDRKRSERSLCSKGGTLFAHFSMHVALSKIRFSVLVVKYRKLLSRSEHTTLEFKYSIAQQTIEQLKKKLKEANSGSISN